MKYDLNPDRDDWRMGSRREWCRWAALVTVAALSALASHFAPGAWFA